MRQVWWILAAIGVVALALCTGCAKRAALRERPAKTAPVEHTVVEPPPAQEPPAPPEPAEPTQLPLLNDPAPPPTDPPAEPDDAPPARAPVEPPKPTPDKPAAEPTAAEKDVWAIPAGPLDDDKYVAIAVKIAAVVGGIPEAQRNADAKRLVVKRVLKEANLTEDEFQAYTEQIAADAARRDRVTGAVEKLLKQRQKTRYRGEVSTEGPR